jgi:AraC-like DNA-binding protein
MITLNTLPRPTITPVNGARTALESAITQMRKNTTQAVDLRSLAKHVDLNPFYLSHMFSKYVGISAKRYHQLVRLSIAKKILAETDMSITDVSIDCGYDSMGSFITMFKKAVGMTPLAFRQQLDTAKLDRQRIPQITPNLVNNAAAERLVVELAAPGSFEGCAFVALCNVDSNALLDCAAISFRQRTIVVFPIGCPQPLVVYAVAYSSSASLRDAIVDEPSLRGHSEIAIASAGKTASVTLGLREKSAFDVPFLLALPLLIQRRAAHLSWDLSIYKSA